ncbi:uncharacterized protein LOC124154383 isoform X2 [Ischnura elegans]|uniref:uncharacterized protein LOC124154383 isoform X2 n=1 Tax=Ischnura elegans TaxID=197161 RepID=UPI001ED86FE3|nr:uncharacterized protein LOC124154383 isoform X2 [Ischnura elegans]XP_046384027.1 uncharacterized protein LOC124154383 isoform X2 [Ischnura elegans]
MASLTQIFTIGCVALFLPFYPCSTFPTAIPERDGTECGTFWHVPVLGLLLWNGLTHYEDEILDAVNHFNNTECPSCQRFCSKIQNRLEFLRDPSIITTEISPRTRNTTEFMIEMAQALVTFGCDNNATQMTAFFNDENRECLRLGGCRDWLEEPSPSNSSSCEDLNLENGFLVGYHACHRSLRQLPPAEVSFPLLVARLEVSKSHGF